MMVNSSQEDGSGSAALSSYAKRQDDLKVSAHAVALQKGLFCIYQEGDASRDLQTGLPFAKIEPAPGDAGANVTVQSLEADGALHGMAAMVKVMAPEAKVLITIYQHKDRPTAPQFHILQLSGGANARSPMTSEMLEDHAMLAHVRGVGDMGCEFGEWLGIQGSAQWIEGFRITPPELDANCIEYRAVLGRDWMSPWVVGNQFCGSRGMALPLLGLEVRLVDAAADTHTCHYQATFVDGSHAGPISGKPIMQVAKDGSSMPALEAFQVVIQAKSDTKRLRP
jgi:hypothetical protein